MSYEEKILELLHVKIFGIGIEPERALAHVKGWISCEFLLGNIESFTKFFLLEEKAETIAANLIKAN